MFEFLRGLLLEHGEFDALSEDEAALLETAAAGAPADVWASAVLHEELGFYSEAETRYLAAVEADQALAGKVHAARLRLARYRRDWAAHAALEADTLGGGSMDSGGDRAPDVAALERGHRLLALGAFSVGRDHLQAAARRHEDSPHAAELHFLAGRAAWFEQDRDWAKFHWCWVLEQRSEDRLQMRARIAAAAEGMPYANPELANYAAPVGNIGTQNIVAAVNAATEVYRELLPAWQANEPRRSRTAEAPPVVEASEVDAGDAPEDPRMAEIREHIAKLSDAAGDYPDASKAASALLDYGDLSVDLLVATMEDEAHPGRGMAATALCKVLAHHGSRPEAAIAAIARACESDNKKLKQFAKSGQRTLKRFPEKSPEEIAAAEAAAAGETSSADLSSPAGMVASLDDSEEQREQNLQLVAGLVTAGDDALDPLMVAVADESHAGRAWAAWALGKVLESTGKRPVGTLKLLARAGDASAPLTREMARAALGLLDF